MVLNLRNLTITIKYNKHGQKNTKFVKGNIFKERSLNLNFLIYGVSNVQIKDLDFFPEPKTKSYYRLKMLRARVYMYTLGALQIVIIPDLGLEKSTYNHFVYIGGHHI